MPLFATCPRGVEPLLVSELAALGATEARERRGGIAFAADRSTAYRICLWSRLANRILMPLASYEIADDKALYEGAAAIAWSELFAVSRSFSIEVAGRSPAVPHTHFAGLRIKDAVVDHFRDHCGERPNVDTVQPDIRIHLHLDRQQATLSLDLGGESLHRRGYRERGGEAPLKENLASAILVRAGWPEIARAGGALLDPMCGSGTLLIEGALMAADVAPGLLRQRYGFEAWNAHDAAAWAELRQEARARAATGLPLLPPILGSDIDPRTLRAAESNATNAGLAGRIQWRTADVSDARPVGSQRGLLVTNPPYGERLAAESEVIKLYSLLGALLKQHFAGWRAAVFTARPDVAPRLGLRATTLHSLYNGALPAKLLCFDIAPKPASRPVTEGPEATSEAAAVADIAAAPQGGEDFANRLRKNLRHLGKWAKRNGIANYRVYDADLNEYALAVDIYQVGGDTHLHVQEYKPPESVDPVRAERRLREALSQLQQVFGLPSARIHYKLRQSQSGSAQYRKQGDTGNFARIEEHGCALWANFDDYLDTGLFLDHRPLRLRIQREARSKRFLNLFCYTGSATAHAVVGGASGSLSIDLSNTYLEWAERNLRLNGVQPSITLTRGQSYGHARAPHKLLRADCLVWLQEQSSAATRPQFDLILCDPPTFSNSKKMDGVLDTQRDHAQMIEQAYALLAPGGRLYFSTNRRRFKFDFDALSALSPKEISGQTLDEDFKRPPPAHRCWVIERRL